MELKILKDISEISNYLLNSILEICQQKQGNIYLSLSGGNTPKQIYQYFCNSVERHIINWERIHIYFVDERCVPPDNADSNYKMTMDYLLTNINIPSENIHRIKGELDPAIACKEYTNEILKNIPTKEKKPVFDWILLGLGNDGHTASIFPESKEIFYSDNICEITVNPYNMQKRLTLTAGIINNSDRISFFVTGTEKCKILQDIIQRNDSEIHYPADLIRKGNPEWILDSAAAAFLK